MLFSLFDSPGSHRAKATFMQQGAWSVATIALMSRLLVGFDSAWKREKSGSIAAVIHHQDGSFRALAPPTECTFEKARGLIEVWRNDECPTRVLILLDQPTIVPNLSGQRPVENIIASPVSLRRGGVQPANRGRHDMFGDSAPLWEFLSEFNGPADPLRATAPTLVIETYPVLAMIALGWTLPDERPKGRLPKYNPQRKGTYSQFDWLHVLRKTTSFYREHSLDAMVQNLQAWPQDRRPRKQDQDSLDALICLLVAMHVGRRSKSLMIGDVTTGYVVVPFSGSLQEEAITRCRASGRDPEYWVRPFVLGA